MSGHSLLAVSQNLVDLIWDDRPALPSNVIEPMSLVYTGMYIIRILTMIFFFCVIISLK